MLRAVQFSSAVSTRHELEAACAEAAERAQAQLTGKPDLCVAFVSPNTLGDPRRLPVLLHERLGPRVLIGCSGGGVIGGGTEVEARSAVSVTLGSLPGVTMQARHLEDGDLPSDDAPPSRWVDLIGMAPADTAGLIVLPEPFTFAADRLIAGLDFAYPKSPKVGGITSGSQQPGGHVLFLDRQCHPGGAIVLALGGDVAVETLVAQGCKPFGKPGRITEARQHDLLAIDGKTPIQFLHEQLEGLEPKDLQLAQENPLFLGIAMDPFAVEPPPAGDYLIRNVLGFDPNSGRMQIGETLSVGRHVQFHFRDRNTSHHDLRLHLERCKRSKRGRPAGALLFSCLGRGRHLYSEEGHDTRLFQEVLGDVPVGGFFCNGEIGPVQGHTFLHGYTSSFGLFRAP